MVVNYNVYPSCHSRTKSVLSLREAFVLWQPPCVRDWSGILCERGRGDGERGTELVEVTVVSTSSTTMSGESEQRYSGKPDGAAGTPKTM